MTVSAEEEHEASIVIDNGSGFIKAGFGGDDEPQIVFPSVIAISKYFDQFQRDFVYIGNEVISKRKMLNKYNISIKHPIEYGIVRSWSNMERIWHHIFDNELCIQPEQHSILLTEIPLNAKANREKMAQTMFEIFNVPSIYIAIQSVLSLYGTGRLTGIVLDSGHDLSHTVPIYEGYALQHNINRLNLAGKDVTRYLSKILIERNAYSFTTSEEMEVIQNLKEKHCYVALDFDAEMERSQISTDIEMNYQLPDGQVISIGNERFRCSEILFKPHFIGKEGKGIHKMIYDSIIKCDIDIRMELYKNIILSGDNMLFDGITDRLNNELKSLVPYSVCNIIDVLYGFPDSKEKHQFVVDGFIRNNKNRNHLYIDIRNMIYQYSHNLFSIPTKYISWIGGSILSSLSIFDEMCVSKDEYEDMGTAIIHRKCF